MKSQVFDDDGMIADIRSFVEEMRNKTSTPNFNDTGVMIGAIDCLLELVEVSTWSKEPPTEPGWYWISLCRNEAEPIEVLTPKHRPDLYVELDNIVFYVKDMTNTHWMKMNVPNSPKE